MARAVSFLSFAGLFQEAGHAEEAVELARVLDERGGHLCLGELLCVLDAFVAQGVVAGHDHERGRCSGRVVDRKWGCVGVSAFRWRAVEVVEPNHRFAGQQVALGVGDHRRGVAVEISDGVDEHLQGRLAASVAIRRSVAAHQCHRCREVAPGAVAADCDALRVDAQLVGIVDHPLRGGTAVVRARREWVLGRQPVVHGHGHDSRQHRQGAARQVVGLDAADNPAAPVEVHEATESAVAVSCRCTVAGLVDAHRDVVAVGPWDRPVFRACYVDLFTGGWHLLEALAGTLWADVLKGRSIQSVELGNDTGCFEFESHGREHIWPHRRRRSAPSNRADYPSSHHRWVWCEWRSRGQAAISGSRWTRMSCAIASPFCIGPKCPNSEKVLSRPLPRAPAMGCASLGGMSFLLAAREPPRATTAGHLTVLSLVYSTGRPVT